MDKFDKVITAAKQTFEPSEHFVDAVMNQITGRQPKKRWGIKVWAPALGGGLAIVAILLIAMPFSARNTASKTLNGPDVYNGPALTSLPTQSNAATPSVTPPAGTDNAGLDSQMNSIDNSLAQENSDQASANSALNDSSQEITVPTD